jgi:hypothetical protein
MLVWQQIPVAALATSSCYIELLTRQALQCNSNTLAAAANGTNRAATVKIAEHSILGSAAQNF